MNNLLPFSPLPNRAWLWSLAILLTIALAFVGPIVLMRSHDEIRPRGTFTTDNLVVNDTTNFAFGTLATALPAQPTVTDDWNPWGAGPRTTLVRVQTDASGSILGSLLGGNTGDIVVLENHGDGSGSYGSGFLKILLKKTSDPGTVANHIYAPNLTDMVIPYTGSVVLYYDQSTIGWIPIAQSLGGSFENLTFSEMSVQYPIIYGALAAGTTNNLDVTTGGFFDGGLKTSSWLKVVADSSGSTLTGIVPHNAAAGPSGLLAQAPVIVLQNEGGPLTLASDNAGSSAGNRFSFPQGDITIQAGQTIVLYYDQLGGGSITAAKWRLMTDTVGAAAKFTLQGETTPTLANGDNPDWNPAGFTATGYLRVVPGAASTVSGMIAQEDGAIRTLAAFGSFTLLHQSGLSAAGNQFYLPTAYQAGGLALALGNSVTVRYDGILQKWWVIGIAQ